jgi:hypothetical protein
VSAQRRSTRRGGCGPRGPRPPRLGGLLLLTVLLAGCGGGTDLAALADPGWEGRAEIDAEAGELTIPGFNEHIDTEKPDWAADPARTAATALQLGRGRDDAGPVELDVLDADVERPVVQVTFTDLGDDSVAAVRYALTLRRGDDGLYRLVEGRYTQRCQPGRGAEGFVTGPCV